jgi:ribonucleotide monophosphatase NagD (HAD superfamily)
MLMSKPLWLALTPVSHTGPNCAVFVTSNLSAAISWAICSKVAIAAAYLSRENVEFIACNTDSTFPAIPGLKLPGAGRRVALAHGNAAALMLTFAHSIVASVMTATGRKPTVTAKSVSFSHHQS